MTDEPRTAATELSPEAMRELTGISDGLRRFDLLLRFWLKYKTDQLVKRRKPYTRRAALTSEAKDD
jgi:hypothetical protein